MASITSHMNVYNTSLRILREKGYKLSLKATENAEGRIIPEVYGWNAEKDGFSFSASTPIELLGLVAIYEFKNPTSDEPYWWVVDGPKIWDELIDSAIIRPEYGDEDVEEN